MIKQCSNVVDKQRIQLLCDLLLVGELEGSLKGNPDTLQVHRTNLDNVACLLALENTITSTSRHAGNIEELGAVDHVIVLTTRNANAFGLDLEAKTAFVFPKRSSHTWLHSWRSHLTSVVECLGLVALRAW
jgi:hypothetical protein